MKRAGDLSWIRFCDLEVTPSRLDIRCITCDAGKVESTHDLWFEFSDDLPLTTTSIAIALSTLCGRAYNQVEYDFPVAERALLLIKEMTQAEVLTSGDERNLDLSRSGNLLSFSGGFDSLAALSLMPEDTNLVSMDFGGRFSRERNFFERFNPLRVSTNIVDTPLRQNSWSFMGIGSILASEYFSARYHTFGGIMEASPDNIKRFPVSARNVTFPPFRAAGFENAPYVLGLTEVGTLRVLLQTKLEIVADSLVSVASPGEEKLYRKAILTEVVANSIDVRITFPEVARPAKPHFRFGGNFAVDMLALYVINQTGIDDALGMVSNIPADVVETAKTMSMQFMERANPTLYENFPKPLETGLHRRLKENGISWYNEHDWHSLSVIRNVLAPYHSVV